MTRREYQDMSEGYSPSFSAPSRVETIDVETGRPSLMCSDCFAQVCDIADGDTLANLISASRGHHCEATS